MTLRVALLSSMLVVGLTGCGGATSTPEASSPTMTRLSTTQVDVTRPSSSEAPEPITELIGFTSPTGNVGCMLDPTFVRCDIAERDWEPPPRPADCEFDYGQGIGMSAGAPPEFVCAGDTALGGGEALAYGASVSAGSLSCDSAESGITCRDADTGRGFTVAREAYQVF